MSSHTTANEAVFSILTGVLGCWACTEVGCCICRGGSGWDCRGVSGWEGAGEEPRTEGGRGKPLGMWVGVTWPPAEAGVEGWVWSGCRLAAADGAEGGGGVEHRADGGPREPTAFRVRLAFCCCCRGEMEGIATQMI